MNHISKPCIGEVGKLLGEKWKALNEKQRQPYDAKAATDKKRYEEEKAAYQVHSLPTPLMSTLSNNNPTNRRSKPTKTRKKRSPSRDHDSLASRSLLRRQAMKMNKRAA
jgi:hypothetical protein